MTTFIVLHARHNNNALLALNVALIEMINAADPLNESAGAVVHMTAPGEDGGASYIVKETRAQIFQLIENHDLGSFFYA